MEPRRIRRNLEGRARWAALPLLLATACLMKPAAAFPGRWKAGAARVDITPRQSLWMAGYAARTKASEGTLQPIYAKALALEDPAGKRYVLVSSDLLGFPAPVSRNIAARAGQRHHLSRDRLLLNSSHTHCGPVVGRMLPVAYDLRAEQWSAIDAYTRELEDKVAGVIDEALNDLRPARLSFGHGEADFGANRRLKINPDGPVDHDVPVMRVDDARGRLRAVVFGYACHNTTLGPDMCRFNGDYAGFAQERLEQQHPGAVALFLMGCGADANPSPRGSIEIARRHGDALAAAVERALGGRLAPLGGSVRSTWEQVPLAFAPPPGREELQKRLEDKNVNVYVQRHARLMLGILDREGRLPADYPYPLQVWQFGRDLTLIAMGGEVVVDYALRLKKELGADRLWVAGYSNDVFAYIPSLRVLREGGYEGAGAMVYYGQPGPFAPSVEETIVSKVHELVDRSRRK
jgi:neutral ceramidase